GMTTVGGWQRGTRINLERALKVGDELGGHIVAGHADGLATVIAREDLTDMARFTLRVPAELARFIATKGSVALDGVSLTVNGVAGDTFSALIIPHTLKATTLGRLGAGDAVTLGGSVSARSGGGLRGPGKPADPRSLASDPIRLVRPPRHWRRGHGRAAPLRRQRGARSRFKRS